MKYDFAFSFAGEDRNIATQIKDSLKEYNVFLDDEHKAELCGKDLYKYLRKLYMNKCKYVVCFISEEYKKKIWTNLEFTAIKERLMSTFFASDFLIPILLEETTLTEDIPSFIGFYKYRNVNDTVSLLKTKIEQSLNEDYYLDNINNFSKYLLQKLADELHIPNKLNGSTITIYSNSYSKSITILPDYFSRIPCLFMYEDNNKRMPSLMIYWNRKESIYFSINYFSHFQPEFSTEFTLKELISTLEKYILYRTENRSEY